MPQRNPSDELWCWRAHYTDGDFLEEYPLDGPDHGFADIDLARCYAIELEPQRDYLGRHVVKVDPASGQRPIFFRRRVKAAATGGEVDPETGAILLIPVESVTVLGWQRTIAGQNVASYTFFFEDGTVLVSDQRIPY